MNMGHKWQYPEKGTRKCSVCAAQEIGAVAAMELGHIGGNLWQAHTPGKPDAKCGKPHWITPAAWFAGGVVVSLALVGMLS